MRDFLNKILYCIIMSKCFHKAIMKREKMIVNSKKTHCADMKGLMS
jgi:hypothetical protein